MMELNNGVAVESSSGPGARLQGRVLHQVLLNAASRAELYSDQFILVQKCRALMGSLNHCVSG